MAESVKSEETAVSDTFDDEDVLTEGPRYNVAPKKTRVSWYRPKLTREELAYFNKRSDFLGFAQTLSYLGLLVLSAPL